LLEGIPLEKVSVGDIMARELVTVDQDEDVYDTIKTMRRKGIRRVPVVDKGNDLIGIITMDDVLEFITEEIKDLSSIFTRETQKEKEERP
jgi:CBS domain-containing protein